VPQIPDIDSVTRLVDALNSAARLEEGLPQVLQAIQRATDADVAVVSLGEEPRIALHTAVRPGLPEVRVRQAHEYVRGMQAALSDPFGLAGESPFNWDWKRELRAGPGSFGLVYLGADAPGSTGHPMTGLLLSVMLQFILRVYVKSGKSEAKATATAQIASFTGLTRKVGEHLNLERDWSRVAELIRKLVSSDQTILIAKKAGQAYSHPSLPHADLKKIVQGSRFAAHALGGGEPVFGPMAEDTGILQGMGFRSAAAFPIRYADQVVGALILLGMAPGIFTPAIGVALDPVLFQLASALGGSELSSELKHSQRQWEVTFDSMSDCVLVADFSGKILRANRALGSRLKAAPDSLAGRTIADALGVEVPLPVERHAHQVRLEIPKLGGSFSVAVSTVLDSPTAPEAYIVVARDLTAEKKLEARLQTLAMAMDALPEGVGICTMEGYLVHANPALKRILGIPPREDRVPLEDQGLFRALAARPRGSGEIEARRRDGSSVPVRYTIGDVGDPPAALAAVVRETTSSTL
jgi:PAS domain-containing protein